MREFLRGQLDGTVDYKLGALTGSRFHIVGEDAGPGPEPVARPDRRPGAARLQRRHARGACRRSSSAADRAATSPGTDSARPACSSTRPTAGSGGWTCSSAASSRAAGAHLSAGARVPARRATRVPPAAVSAFSPRSVSGYVEAQTRVADIAVTAGLRYDQFDPRTRERRRVARRAAHAEPALRRLDRARRAPRSWRATAASPRRPTTSSWWTRRSTTPRGPGGSAAATPTSDSSGATQYEFSVRVRPARVDLAPGGRLREAARRPGGLGAARSRSRLDHLRQRRRRHDARGRDPGGAGAAGRLRLPHRLHPARRQGHVHRCRSCSTA